MSILSLHSDHAACGRQLIGHCRSISCKLTNPEVDARLLTDVMQQLMFSAKLMFVKAGRSQDLALCDRSDHTHSLTHTLIHATVLKDTLMCFYVLCFISRHLQLHQ